MQHKKTGLALALLISSIAIGSANASVLTFDDIPGQHPSYWAGPINDENLGVPDYHGYVFPGFQWVSVNNIGATSVLMGTVSGDYAMISDEWWRPAAAITTQAHSLFTFDGLWAKKWYTPADSGDNDGSDGVSGYREGMVSGYKDGIEVWSIALTLNGSYQYVSGQSETIDTLTLKGPILRHAN